MSVIEDLAELFAPLDRSWWAQATCHAWIQDHPWKPTPWTLASNDPPVDGVPAHKLVDYALLCCSACPAQYRCATFGVEHEASAGTYAMRVRQLKWLRKQDDWREIIASAQMEAMPVQVVVKRVRRERG